jgi:hypothetical protein
LQLLQELGDSDDEAADGPSSEEKPAGRRSKKAKRYEDSDFEVGPAAANLNLPGMVAAWQVTT